MPTHYDTIILGLGAMGSAAAWQLARRGKTVLGLEQFNFAHDRGSSHGESRIIRLSYFEHPDYVPLLLRAYDNWYELERDSNRKLLHEVGGIYIGPPDGEFIAGSRRAAQQYQLPHEDVPHDHLRKRYPMLRVPQHMTGLYEPRAGFVLAEATIQACIDTATTNGADLRSNTPVRHWTADDRGVQVQTDNETFHGDHLIIAAGAWTSSIVRDLGVPLKVTRQAMGWFQPRHPERFALGTFPVWAMEDQRGGLAYGFPSLPTGRPGVKVARHLPGRVTDPAMIDRTADETDKAEVQTIVQEILPDEAGPMLSHAICMYTVTPDEHFIIDRHPHHANVTLACGFSGHGFKFTSVIGEILADLACDGATNQPIAFLRLNRFRDV